MKKGLIGAKIKEPKWTRQQWKKYRANVLRLRWLNKKDGNGFGLLSGRTNVLSSGTTPTKRTGLYAAGGVTARIVGGGLPSLGKKH